MARLARAVFAGLPHHVTQRGNGRARTFFSDDDYRLYRDLLATPYARHVHLRRKKSGHFWQGKRGRKPAAAEA